jgi:hypothetical protein
VEVIFFKQLGPWFVNGGSNTNGVNSYIRQGSPYLFAPQMSLNFFNIRDGQIQNMVQNAM